MLSKLFLKEQQELFTSRDRNAHKGDFGCVLIVGGYYGMGGAVRMAGEAALRVGAGLVKVITMPENILMVNAGRPELMCYDAKAIDVLMRDANVVLVGPGLGQDKWGKQLLKKILRLNIPIIVDADALNIFARQSVKKRNNWVLTPHPGEAARLLQVSTDKIQEDRHYAIAQLQKKFSGTIILKGAGTLILGNDDITYICDAGNPGMASGGMGDVLSGVIAGLIAQGFSLLDAAKTAVCIHAHAGDRAAKVGERGLLASDLFVELRSLVNPC